MVGRRAKRGENWYFGVFVVCIRGTFDILVFKVILGSFNAVVTEWPVPRKRKAMERNGVKFDTRG